MKKKSRDWESVCAIKLEIKFLIQDPPVAFSHAEGPTQREVHRLGHLVSVYVFC